MQQTQPKNLWKKLKSKRQSCPLSSNNIARYNPTLAPPEESKQKKEVLLKNFQSRIISKSQLQPNIHSPRKILEKRTSQKSNNSVLGINGKISFIAPISYDQYWKKSTNLFSDNVFETSKSFFVNTINCSQNSNRKPSLPKIVQAKYKENLRKNNQQILMLQQKYLILKSDIEKSLMQERKTIQETFNQIQKIYQNKIREQYEQIKMLQQRINQIEERYNAQDEISSKQNNELRQTGNFNNIIPKICFFSQTKQIMQNFQFNRKIMTPIATFGQIHSQNSPRYNPNQHQCQSDILQCSENENNYSSNRQYKKTKSSAICIQLSSRQKSKTVFGCKMDQNYSQCSSYKCSIDVKRVDFSKKSQRFTKIEHLLDKLKSNMREISFIQKSQQSFEIIKKKPLQERSYKILDRKTINLLQKKSLPLDIEKMNLNMKQFQFDKQNFCNHLVQQQSNNRGTFLKSQAWE